MLTFPNSKAYKYKYAHLNKRLLLDELLYQTNEKEKVPNHFPNYGAMAVQKSSKQLSK